MGSFNSKAASKQHPMVIDLSKGENNNNEQRKEDGESEKNIEKCTESDGDMDPSQNPEVEDACTTKRSQCRITSEPKRSVNVASYLWLSSSPIIQDEECLMKESAVKYRYPEPSTSSLPSRRTTKDESVQSVSFRPQFYSYPTNGTCTKTRPTNGKRHDAPTRTARNKATPRSKASSPFVITDRTALNRSIGFGVDKTFSHPAQRS